MFDLGFLYLGFSGVFLLKKCADFLKIQGAALTLGTIHRELFSLKKLHIASSSNPGLKVAVSR